MAVNEELKDIKELLMKMNAREGVTESKFKFPFGKKVSKGQKKKNYILVIIAYENGNIDFKKYQIEDQTFVHDLIPRLAGAGHIMHYKDMPVVFLPNWSVEPFSCLKHFQESMIDGSNTTGYKLLMAKMKKDLVNPKKQMSGIGKWIIGLGFLLVIGFALLTGGG